MTTGVACSTTENKETAQIRTCCTSAINPSFSYKETTQFI